MNSMNDHEKIRALEAALACVVDHICGGVGGDLAREIARVSAALGLEKHQAEVAIEAAKAVAARSSWRD